MSNIDPIRSLSPRGGARARLRMAAYWMLIVTSAGGMTGRTLSIEGEQSTPFLSANDRSRWTTIRSLGDEGTYVIDTVVLVDAGADSPAWKFDPAWQTIDMVRHKGADGREHFYSSKPTLLPTLLAGEYFVISRLTGATLAEQPFFVGRLMLLLTNVLPMVLFFVLLCRIAERYGRTHWGRLLVMGTATWGTYLTTFAVTLNNHLPAAISVLVSLWALLAVVREGKRSWGCFLAAGLFAGFAAANELPALAWLALAAALLLWKSPLRTLLAFAPAALLVAAGFFGTNYLAHGSWEPAYAHRDRDGVLLVSLDEGGEELDAGKISDEMRGALRREAGIDLSNETEVEPRDPGRRWMLWDADGEDRLAAVRGDGKIHLHAWDDWYDYRGSYWTSNKRSGVDLGEPNPLIYAFHVMFGHHGVFSLTPIWLLAAVGVGIMLVRGPAAERIMGGAIASLTIVVLVFYITRPLGDRNYGGVTSGLRWTFWLIPLWLYALLPAADAAARSRWLRWPALLLLLIGVAAAAHAWSNPWRHPWLYDYWMWLEWIE